MPESKIDSTNVKHSGKYCTVTLGKDFCKIIMHSFTASLRPVFLNFFGHQHPLQQDNAVSHPHI